MLIPSKRGVPRVGSLFSGRGREIAVYVINIIARLLESSRAYRVFLLARRWPI